MLSHFHRIPEGDGQTDRQTELLYQYRVTTRDKNSQWQPTIPRQSFPDQPIKNNPLSYYKLAAQQQYNQ